MTDSNRPLRVAVVGAGPAGIYASDILSKADLSGTGFDGVGIDLFERLPAPFGLVRYGVAPDHPRIKQIIVALEKVLSRGDIRLLTNVDFGNDVTLEDLQRYYDAVIFSTGSIEDARLEIPGVDAPESYGAADFVSWYDGHPDFPRTWPLDAERVAVLGAGKRGPRRGPHPRQARRRPPSDGDPGQRLRRLKASPVTDVHVFARRGPAQVKFSPLELRELGHVPDVDVLVDPEDFDFDEGSEQAIASSNQTRQVVKTLTDWTLKEGESTASRRIHLHFLHAPAEVLTDADGHVSGLRTERTRLVGDGTVEGTGDFHDWDVQAVYRAVGYFGSPLPGVPFDALAGVIANHEGRVTDPEGGSLPGVYCTGWIKRGPVGLIGHTKSDASETVRHLVSDAAQLPQASEPDPQAVLDFLRGKGVEVLTWTEWETLDAYERSLGERARPRARQGGLARGHDRGLRRAGAGEA